MEWKTSRQHPGALAALDKPPAETAAAPQRRISKKVIAAIDKMVSGECKKITEAAEAVGMARESLSRADERASRGAMLPGLQIVVLNGTATPKIIGPAPFPQPGVIEHGPAAHAE